MIFSFYILPNYEGFKKKLRVDCKKGFEDLLDWALLPKSESI